MKICEETKITNKSCIPIQKETELLILIHTDFSDLQQIMTRGGKRYYAIFIDDYSRYTKLYLLRNNENTHNDFLSYKFKEKIN